MSDCHSPATAILKQFNIFKSKTIPFTKDEDQSIINWIIRYQVFNCLKQTSIWRSMEDSGDVGNQRSWTSLKDRFETHIASNIESFTMTRRNMKRFRSALEMSGTNLNNNPPLFSSSEEEQLEFDVSAENIFKRIKSRKSKPRQEDLCKSSDDEVDSPRNANRRKRKRKFAPVPDLALDSSPDESSRSCSHDSPLLSDGADDQEVEEHEELDQLLDNSNIPDLLAGNSKVEGSDEVSKASESNAQLREDDQETLSRNSLDVSRMNERSIEQHHHDTAPPEPANLEQVPSLEEFSAGLVHVSSRRVDEEAAPVPGLEVLDDLNITGNQDHVGGETFQDQDHSQRSTALSKTDAGTEDDVFSSSEDDDHTGRMKKIEAHIGYDKEDVFLVIRSLPKDINLSNIQIVHASSRNLPDQEEHDQTVTKNKKLRIISLDSSGTRRKHSKSYRNGGRFKEKFRTPYSLQVSFSRLKYCNPHSNY